MDWDVILTIASHVVLHWPFLAVAILLGLTGEVVKGLVLGEDSKAAEKSKFLTLYKRTLRLHPVIAGALLGLVLSATLPDVVLTGGITSSMLYFSLSGAVSGVVYDILKSLYPELTKALRKKIAVWAGKSAKEEKEED